TQVDQTISRMNTSCISSQPEKQKRGLEANRSLRQSLFKLGPAPSCSAETHTWANKNRRMIVLRKMPQRGAWLDPNCTCPAGFCSLHMKRNMEAK
ncbi:hypothetical protein GOODEAATRI_032158, partial [Goodea atripinnis]